MADKEFDTYQKRLRFVINRVGGQSELARQASELLKRDDPSIPKDSQPISAASIEYLQATERKGKKEEEFKPAQGSQWTPLFAYVGNVRALWLAHGIGPMDLDHSKAANAAAHYVDTKPPEKRERMVKALEEIGALMEGKEEVASDTRVRVAFAEAAEQKARRKFAAVSRKTKPIKPTPLFDREPRKPEDE